MEASAWPDWLDDIWAKSPEGNRHEGESLSQHTWQALQKLRDLVDLRPDLPEKLETPYLWNVLFWAVFLHDFGKAASGFQQRLRGGSRWPQRHEVFSLIFTDWLTDGITENERLWLIAAIVSHHREAKDIQLLYPPSDDLDEMANDQVADYLKEIGEKTLRGLWQWLTECAPIWMRDLSFDTHGVASPGFMAEKDAINLVNKYGAERIYAHLRSYRHLVRDLERSPGKGYIIGLLSLRGHMMNSDHSASAHTSSLPKLNLDRENVLTTCGRTWNNLFEHQRAAAQTKGSVLLTAPTGSGKTEAALLWAASQVESSSNCAPRLFYTLPYQASMNAMKLRLDKTFGEESVGLQHSRSLLAMYRLLLEHEYEPSQAAKYSAWSKNLARLNYQPVRIFSPYQMLKGMYRLKGYEALLNDYHGALFVFDEIHAYEVKRLALILKTIEFLNRNYQARFMIMSATFPDLIKNWLVESLGEPIQIGASPELYTEFQRHRLKILEGDLLADSNLAQVAADVRAGKSVLVVCNTVKRSQQICDLLKGFLKTSDAAIILLHSQFNMRDRSSKEKMVRQYAGRDESQRRPVLLVSTQVVEVSLDIDLDTIYTDPAPLEALVQRFGRVNRRRKNKLSLVHVFRQPEDGQGIYDPALVAITLSILERQHDKALNEAAIGDWLNKEIYAGEIAERWLKEYTESATEFEASCVHTLRPFDADDELESLFYKAFDGTEVLPLCLEEEYGKMMQTNPIWAAELSVPISYRRLMQLSKSNRVVSLKGTWPIVVDASYNGETGLNFVGEPISE